MSDPAQFGWLDHPLSEHLLRFNLVLDHRDDIDALPSWIAQLSDESQLNIDHLLDDITVSRVLRHSSGSALDKLPPQSMWVDNFSDPALPIFMASPDVFEQLEIYCGLVALSPAVRQVIARDELLVIRRDLSDAEYEFVRLHATQFFSGCGVIQLQRETFRMQAHNLGMQLIFWAAGQASSAVASRARLRFSSQIHSLPDGWPVSLKEERMALKLVWSVLKEIDSSWIARFPDFH